MRLYQSIMSLWLALAVATLFLAVFTAASPDSQLNFTFNGFRSANLTIDGIAGFTSTGLLQLTNGTIQRTAHAFYPDPVTFKNSTNGTAAAASSFSTSFVFAIFSDFRPRLSVHGFAFVLAPTRGLPGSLPSQHLGLFNNSNNGNPGNHIVAVEFDTVQNIEFHDIDNNHAGIDINSLTSEVQKSAAYYDNAMGQFRNFSMYSAHPIRVWIEYDGLEKRMDVTLAPLGVPKPQRPLLSLKKDLSPILKEEMFVGFSSGTGSLVIFHYILGWSFSLNGRAQELQISHLPKLPRIGPKKRSKFLTIGLPIITLSLVISVAYWIVYVIRRKRKFAELVEDWEFEYGPHRFKYRDLYMATNGFKDLLGSGGFGRVYRGVLPNLQAEIAVKRVSHQSNSNLAMKQFVAEIASLGRLRHRNLVPLLGYSRRKDELLLVYEFMPNGSLEKCIFNNPKITLNWRQRFIIIKGVAFGLFYLHEQWEQVVIHRDVKASNVLLDGELNGRLGDFGLARLYDHGADPQTTHVVGTLGYLAPEHTRTGKATTSTDVYAFGAFLLEVATGRRPINPNSELEDFILVDWVFSFWQKGEILEARDARLGDDFAAEEVELVLKLGLLCSHSEAAARPSMRQVLRYLEGEMRLPDMSALGLFSGGVIFSHSDGFSVFSSFATKGTYSTSSVAAESLLSGGR